MAGTRRVTIDLTEEASAEIERIRAVTGLTIADIFRHSFTLLRIYLEAKDEGKLMRIFNPKKPRDQVQIELPTLRISIPKSKSEAQSIK
ncbi:MAG: hypothetical protein JWN70_4459 [Planctomycetaceae bacterium]|nr:hypothetical protein [Planctomycetaceae bacterium]